ncbi:unnamed protein product [Auanema sp. JU1783]|nr:unnamed protein product [Auanema sp. JU1783]
MQAAICLLAFCAAVAAETYSADKRDFSRDIMSFGKRSSDSFDRNIMSFGKRSEFERNLMPFGKRSAGFDRDIMSFGKRSFDRDIMAFGKRSLAAPGLVTDSTLYNTPMGKREDFERNIMFFGRRK